MHFLLLEMTSDHVSQARQRALPIFAATVVSRGAGTVERSSLSLSALLHPGGVLSSVLVVANSRRQPLT